MLSIISAVRHRLHRLPFTFTEIMDALLSMRLRPIIQLEPMTKNIFLLQPKLFIMLRLLRLLWLKMMLVQFMRAG